MSADNASRGADGGPGLGYMVHQFGVNHADVAVVSAVLRRGVPVPAQFTDPTCAAVIARRVDEYVTSQSQVRCADACQRRIARELSRAVHKGLRPVDGIDVLLGGDVDIDSLVGTVFWVVEHGGAVPSEQPFGGLFGPRASRQTRVATGICVMALLLAHPKDACPEAWALLPGLS